VRRTVTRLAGLMAATGLAAGSLTLAAGTATPAIAGTTDTGGSAVVTLAGPVVAGLARAGIVVLPAGTGTAAASGLRESITLQVTGGNGDYVTGTGHLSLDGSLVLLDGSTGRSATLGQLRFSYDSAKIVAIPVGSGQIPVVSVGGALAATTNPGPPVSQSFSASSLIVTASGARYLDNKLHTRYFKSGADIGEFAATYDTAATG
jgi:hypothetical protein